MTWEQYRRKLNAEGYIAIKGAPSGAGYEHKRTGKRIYPHEFKEQPDGTRRTNWSYWAENDHVPPPF